MKQVNDLKRRLGQRGLRRSRWWVLLVVVIPIVGLGSVAVAGRFWQPDAGLDAYRYQFFQSSQKSITLALGDQIEFYQQRIQQSPTDGLDRAALASSYLKMARATGDANWYLLAEQSAQRSLANLPFNNQAATLVLARVTEASHNFPEALRLAGQVLQAQPGHEDAQAILVTSNLAMGKVDVADRAANTLVEQVPTLGSLTLLALVRVAQGQDGAAIEMFQQAIAAEEPNEQGSSAWARTLLGRLYFQRGDHTRSRGLYQEALRILPRYPLALIHLAELEMRQGRYRSAERLYAQVYTSPNYPNIYDHVAFQGRAQLKALQGDRAGAEDLWAKAEALLRQHQSLTAFGHRRELAQLLLQRDRSQDRTEALTLMQAEVRGRRDAETLDTLAWALSRLERWQDAQKTVQEALQYGTRNAGLFYRAAMIEQALGNASQAGIYVWLATATDPTLDAQARSLLGLEAKPLKTTLSDW